MYIPSLSEIMAVAQSRGVDSDAPELWNGLVLDLPIAAGGGITAFDVSGYGKPGTLTNMDPATDWIPSKYGCAVNTDGANDYIDCGEGGGLWDPGTGPFSVVALLRRTSYTAFDRVLGKAPASTYDLTNGWIIEDFVEIRAYVGNGAGGAVMVDFGEIPSTNLDWHHIALTLDGSNIIAYTDGRVDDADTYAVAIDNATNFQIACRASGASCWNGDFAHIALYNRTLSPAEVAFMSADPHAMHRLRRKVYSAVAGAAIVTPSSVSAIWSVVAPTLKKTVAPAPAAATWSVVYPGLAKRLIPTPPAAAAWSVVYPGLAKRLIPTPPVAGWSGPVPTVVKSISPSPVAVTWAVAAPGLAKRLTPFPLSLAWSPIVPSTGAGALLPRMLAEGLYVGSPL